MSTDNVLDFLRENDLFYWGTFGKMKCTDKGLRLLNYLGLKYDMESYFRYRQVFKAIPMEHKDSIKLRTLKDEIGRQISKFGFVHSIIVPIYYNNGDPIPEEILLKLRQEFVAHFGGATRFGVSGDFLSNYGLQEDVCDILEGFGSKDNYEADKDFMRNFAIKIGSSDFCRQDAVAITEKAGEIEIIETLDMNKEIEAMQNSRFFSLRTMVLLAGIAATDETQENMIYVENLRGSLGI